MKARAADVPLLPSFLIAMTITGERGGNNAPQAATGTLHDADGSLTSGQGTPTGCHQRPFEAARWAVDARTCCSARASIHASTNVA